MADIPDPVMVGLLGGGPWTRRSKATTFYNCIAWAVNIDYQWWSHIVDRRYHWPLGVPRSPESYALILAIQTEGFTLCNDDAYEPGFDKIALFEKNGQWQHACRIVQEGWWSKMGPGPDGLHDRAGAEHHYGRVYAFMRKPKPTSS